VEPNQINILAFTVLGDLEQIDQAQETRLARQLRSDVRKPERLDGIHFDLTFLHPITGAYLDVERLPNSDAAGDLSAPDSVAQTLGEDHEKSLLSWAYYCG